MTDRARETAETLRLGRRAVELGRDDAFALCSAGAALVFVAGDFEGGGASIERALALNPNLAWAWLSGALLRAFSGESEAAIEHATRALRLSPHDTQVFAMQFAVGLAHFFAGRPAEALSWAEKATRERPDHIPATALAAAGAAELGDRPAVDRAMARLHQLLPGLRVAGLGTLFPIRRPEDLARWIAAMRKAGVPE